jgi:putative hemolysin
LFDSLPKYSKDNPLLNDGIIESLLLVFVLLVVQALITMAYAALMNTRLSTFRDNGEQGTSRLLTLISSTRTTLTYYTVCLLLMFAMAAIVVLNVSEPIVPAYVLELFLLACVVIVFGNTVPEAIGSTHSESLLPFAGALIGILVWVLTPLTVFLVYISQILSAPFKSDDMVNTVTEEEIMTMVDAGHTGGTIEEEEKDMIYSVLQLGETHVSEMMIPRIDISGINIHQSLDEAAEIFVNTGFSRIPVYEESLDNIHGLLYAKDLLARWHNSDEDTTISALTRPAYFVPETKHADELLKELQSRKVHMAIVVDEYGGTAGLVTIEDIIEEIIGDIQDEYDLNEEDEYEQTGEHEYVVDAGIDIDDFNDLLDVNLPTDHSDTLAGFIYTHFGRVPKVDEAIDDEAVYLRVMSVDGRRIRKVYTRRKVLSDKAEESTHDTALSQEKDDLG